MSTAYHPQTDGQTERANQEIETYLRIYCSRHPETWIDHLTEIEFCHNNREQAAIRESPFYVMMGYHPTLWPEHFPSDLANIPSVTDRLSQLSQIRSEALAAQELARSIMAERNSKHFVPFHEGEMVWLDSRNIPLPTPAKFKQRQVRPFKVLKRHSRLAYELELPPGWRIHPVFNAALLSRARRTAAHGPSFAEPSPEIIDGEEEWEVDAILADKKVGRRTMYLVSWKGYSDSDNEWVSAADLANAPDLVAAYKEAKQSRNKSARSRRRLQ